MITRKEIPVRATLLGIGVLNWSGEERMTDRYGFVTLYDNVAGDAVVLSRTACRHVDHQRGRLVAKVIVSRESSHIGDIARNIVPTRPAEGELIDLGAVDGEITHILSPVFSVGIIPDQNRSGAWLDVGALYRVHEQTVHLYFVPEGET